MKIPRTAVVLNRTNKVAKSGVYPVHLRITINRVPKYYKVPIPQKIVKNQWAGKQDEWVKNTHPFAFEINNKILEKLTVVRDLIKRSYNANKNLGFATIFQHLNKKGNHNSFYDYMKGYIKKPPEKLEPNTIKKYQTCLKHLQLFKKQLFFYDIDNDLIKGFHTYMQTELNLAGAACKKYMEAFKKVIRQARKDQYLDPAQMEFLFDDIKIKVPKARRVFLEPKEIKAWKDVRFTPEQAHLERDRDLFLFQIYTGYYYKDFSIFTKDQLLEDEEYGYIIVGARDKNGNQTIIPLFKFPYSSIIIRKYRSNQDCKTVFDPIHLIEDQVFNRHLKEIAKLAGITKNISNKIARHTNAQLWVRYGAERPVLSKMMGHTKEETTRNYFDINIPEIVEGTKRANFQKLGI